MKELWFWRVVAVTASLGWAATAWVQPDTEPVPPAPIAKASDTPRAPRARATPVRPFAPSAQRPQSMPQAVASADAPTPEVYLDKARAEVRSEMRARHEAHREERLNDVLDEVAAFVDEMGLNQDEYAAISTAVLSMHERMAEMGPPMPGEEGPTREERRATMEASFERFHEELETAVGAETADAFHTWMRPPDRRGPGGPRP